MLVLVYIPRSRYKQLYEILPRPWAYTVNARTSNKQLHVIWYALEISKHLLGVYSRPDKEVSTSLFDWI